MKKIPIYLLLYYEEDDPVKTLVDRFSPRFPLYALS
jgi:hypothetical protein